MENAVDAMKMAFAMLVFVVALSLSMYSFTMVRQTSAKITQDADLKEYYDRLSLNETSEQTGYATSAVAASSRVVGVETVIPSLYRYYKENYTVLFYAGTGYDSNTGKFESIEPLTLYHTETDEKYLEKSSLVNPTDTRGIFGFDIQDEQVRREPWSATEATDYSFIKAFINGIETDRYYTTKVKSPWNGRVYSKDSNGPYYTIDFSVAGSILKGLIGKNYKFVERYGEYNYNNVLKDTSTDDNTEIDIDSSITGSVDVLENGEIINKRNQTTKRVIQYILIK